MLVGHDGKRIEEPGDAGKDAPQAGAQAEPGRGDAPQNASDMPQGASADAAKDAFSEEEVNSVFHAKVKRSVKLAVALFVVGAVFLSLFLGRYSMNPVEVVGAAASYIPKLCLLAWTNLNILVDFIGGWVSGSLPDGSSPAFYSVDDINITDPERVLFLIRAPRVFVVMLVGAGLAVAGASYQGMFKNPLTSPDLLGASAGASLGACLALLWNWSGEGVQFAAFLGGLAAVGMAVWLNRLVDYDPTLGLVLAGILVSTLFQSGMSIVKLLADSNDKLPEITFWLMGSFNDITVRDALVVVPMALGFILLIVQSWKLNVLSFGDEEARAMGINTKRTRAIVILASTLLASASVAVAGIIGWIGLVIPHLARAVVGPNYRVLLPTSMLIGSAFLLLVDNLARLLLSVEIPIGILTSILGVPFFIFIFKKNMRGWN